MFVSRQASKLSQITKSSIFTDVRTMSSSAMGSGAGKGGGSGGSVREAGGAMGKREAAQEDAYFRKKNNEMKEKLKQHFANEIKKHEDAIASNQKLMKDMEKEK